MKFKIGDVVQLKSGGPKMTVSGEGLMPGSVICQWFVTNPYELKESTFANGRA